MPDSNLWKWGLPFLNIASVVPSTHALGPGQRAAVWVHGCPIHCPHCIVPEWWPDSFSHLVKPEILAEEILALPEISGITISGGEPTLQAAGLVHLIRTARSLRDISIICFSGFTLEELRTRPAETGVPELLSELDVLVDGPYIHAQNDNLGLRGSTNQRIHHLGNRLKEFDLSSQPRQIEFFVEGESLVMAGIPPRQFRSMVNWALRNLGQF
ncbi:MAG TPA: 4Fe-4S single cluster domain-containing protein [Anaerolineaceae bacterium]|nr:4Fe-4S single cluster domain-containing protein [Anaerolineaceae bacterium]